VDQPPRLPEPISSVTVPSVFHPSGFTRLEACPLSVLGHPSDDPGECLGTHPTAYLGTILHHVRCELAEGRWGDVQDPLQAADDLFAAAVQDVEHELGVRPDTADLVPLRESVGRRRWKRGSRDLRTWAMSQRPQDIEQPPRKLTLVRPRARSAPEELPTVVLGSEKAVSNASLRLRGRPDSSQKTGPKEIELVDYKSGLIKDRDDRLLDEHLVQLQLYALMIEAAFPGFTIHPFVEQADRTEVPWGPIEREQITERLDEVSARLPAEAVLSASEVSSPGRHCRTCRLRPVCTAYLDQAPGWWRAVQDSPRPLPNDVWGTVTTVVRDRDSVSIRITDATGRRVRVDGLLDPQIVTAISEGHFVWLFDLEASEDTEQHGTLVHPRNFHQYLPGPGWERARQVRAFLEPGVS
jgi:CRISPR/Cas system-associated exonuclease Cas4 (RecB family)